EARFEPNSYGFRPGRSCWDAIQAIFVSFKDKPKYVLDADIAKCFDRINHEELLKKVRASPTVTRQLRAWLKAGCLDGEQLFPTEAGTPQGGTITPQTILQTAPFGAVSKRAGVHLVDDPHLFGIHLHALDQGTQDLALGGPRRLFQALGDAPRELVQLADDRLHRLLLGRSLRGRPRLALHRLQPLPPPPQPPPHPPPPPPPP